MTGMALNIGLRSVDPNAHEGWNEEVPSCEEDAKAMHSIAESKGYAATLLLTEQVTRDALKSMFCDASGRLKAGDIFFLTFSGHGFRRRDENSALIGKFQEAWIVFDGEIIDAELNGWLRSFKEGVRIVVVSESCKSGSILEPPSPFSGSLDFGRESLGRVVSKRLSVPIDVVKKLREARKEKYAALEAQYQSVNAHPVKARVLLFAACQENQDADIAGIHGLFTTVLLEVWRYAINYADLETRIEAKMPDLNRQKPNFHALGQPIPGFEESLPFLIARAGSQ